MNNVQFDKGSLLLHRRASRSDDNKISGKIYTPEPRKPVNRGMLLDNPLSRMPPYAVTLQHHPLSPFSVHPGSPYMYPASSFLFHPCSPYNVVSPMLPPSPYGASITKGIGKPSVFVFPPASATLPTHKRRLEEKHTDLTSKRFKVSPTPQSDAQRRHREENKPLDLSKDSAISRQTPPKRQAFCEQNSVIQKKIINHPDQPLDLTIKPKSPTPSASSQTERGTQYSSPTKEADNTNGHRVQRVATKCPSPLAKTKPRVLVPTDPRKWSKEHVRMWLEHMARTHHINDLDMSRFSMNGKALCLMREEMFKYRVPNGGGLLYRDFCFRVIKIMALEKELLARNAIAQQRPKTDSTNTSPHKCTESEKSYMYKSPAINGSSSGRTYTHSNDNNNSSQQKSSPVRMTTHNTRTISTSCNNNASSNEHTLTYKARFQEKIAVS